MPLMYDPASIPHGFDTGPDSLTEQEHKDSCDINKIIGRMARGLDVNTKKLAPWGENFIDDTTMDAVKHRIQKEKIENDLKALASEPIEEKDWELIPASIKEKFGFKKKVKQEPAGKNDDKTTKKPPEPVNDDQTESSDGPEEP